MVTVKNYVTVKQLIDLANLEILGGNGGIENHITMDEITFPWMEFAGYFTYFDPNRLILIGSKELMYLTNLDKDKFMHDFRLTEVQYQYFYQAAYWDYERINRYRF